MDYNVGVVLGGSLTSPQIPHTKGRQLLGLKFHNAMIYMGSGEPAGARTFGLVLHHLILL